jgi:hypothetical protein
MTDRSDPLSTALACVRRLSDEGLDHLERSMAEERSRRCLDRLMAAHDRGELLVQPAGFLGRGKPGKFHVAAEVEGVEPFYSETGKVKRARTACGQTVHDAKVFLAGPRRPPAKGEWVVRSFDIDCETCKGARA